MADTSKGWSVASYDKGAAAQDDIYNDRTAAFIVKRGVDLSLAAVALLLLLPAFAAIAALIKADSRGPVLFKQVRVGKHGRPFVMYKFRSMRDADNDTAHQHFVRALFDRDYRHAEGDAYKVAGDGRITRVGAFLRRTSLDELPQLINVLKGEMSLVGPRPDLPYSVELYEQRHFRRLSVLPGITGLWQVSGRSEKSLLEMLELDVEYVNTWSFWLDITILARTIAVVIKGQGAS